MQSKYEPRSVYVEYTENVLDVMTRAIDVAEDGHIPAVNRAPVEAGLLVAHGMLVVHQGGTPPRGAEVFIGEALGPGWAATYAATWAESRSQRRA